MKKHEIVCITCKCSSNDEIFKKCTMELGERGTPEFRKQIMAFRSKHNHGNNILRPKKKETYLKDLKIREERMKKGKKNVSSTSS